MTKNEPARPELVRTGSHSVTLQPVNGASHFKEEVFLTFCTAWRGKGAEVKMRADRYTHSAGLSDWRVYAVEAQGIESTGRGWSGRDLTETARHRLGELAAPVAREWLESGSYRASEADAWFRAVRREFDDLRPYSDHPADRVREAVTRWRNKMTPQAAAQLVLTADAFDAFAAMYRAEL